MSISKICFLGFFPDYETLFFNEMDATDLDISVFNPKDITDKKPYFSKLPRVLRNKQQKKIIQNYINDHLDTIFIFNEHRLALQAILQYLDTAHHSQFKGILLLRNPLGTNHKVKQLLPQLESYGVKILTFDEADAQKYGYATYPQFASRLSAVVDTPMIYDFSFIGRDKGRKEVLQKLEAQLTHFGYRCHFDIRSENQPNISYIEYLKYSLSAKCMVEILQNNQSGMTLRAIEALLYERKLLTNNINIKHTTIYDSSIILLTNDIDEDTVKSFIDSNATPLKYHHSIKPHITVNAIQHIINNVCFN